jgi:Xaa-Pro aminopeptidase
MRRGVALLCVVALGACADDEGPGVPASPSTPAPHIAALREAARITGLAQSEVLRRARPGLHESDIKSAIDAVFSHAGVSELAFDPIVASGPNALTLHYAGATRELASGDLLVVDIGAKSAGYAADLTRTFPVDPRYTARQRELYELVRAVHDELARTARTGQDSLLTLQARTVAALRASPLRARDEQGLEATMERFYIHFIGHYIGRQVHGEDTGWDSGQPLAEGQTLTIEPGLYVASEGLGLRIEDDYVVTASGLECLSCDVPRTADEIERLRALAATAPLPRAPSAARLPSDPAATARPHMDFGPR